MVTSARKIRSIYGNSTERVSLQKKTASLAMRLIFTFYLIKKEVYIKQPRMKKIDEKHHKLNNPLRVYTKRWGKNRNKDSICGYVEL